MNQISEIVRKFFEDYERGGRALDLELPAAQYGDLFMFAGTQGVQAIKKEDFLKVLPKRAEFFKSVGLVSSEIQSLEETRLDDHYYGQGGLDDALGKRTGPAHRRSTCCHLHSISAGRFLVDCIPA